MFGLLRNIILVLLLVSVVIQILFLIRTKDIPRIIMLADLVMLLIIGWTYLIKYVLSTPNTAQSSIIISLCSLVLTVLTIQDAKLIVSYFIKRSRVRQHERDSRKEQ